MIGHVLREEGRGAAMRVEGDGRTGRTIPP
jgi:hypothetical protein